MPRRGPSAPSLSEARLVITAAPTVTVGMRPSWHIPDQRRHRSVSYLALERDDVSLTRGKRPAGAVGDLRLGSRRNPT